MEGGGGRQLIIFLIDLNLILIYDKDCGFSGVKFKLFLIPKLLIPSSSLDKSYSSYSLTLSM